MKKTTLLCLFIIPFWLQSTAQSNQGILTPGFNLKLRFEFGNQTYANFQASAALGVNYQLPKDAQFISMTYHLAANLYRGGLGSSILLNDANRFRFEIVNSFGATVGFSGKHDFNPAEFRRPIYYWNNVTATPLLNPYEYGATLSSNFIWCNLKNDTSIASINQSQQILFVGANVKSVSIGIYNDGGLLDNLGISDGFDRYWTGGGFISAKLNDSNGFGGQIQVNYDRYTGYTRDAYETAGLLGYRYVPYGNNSKWNQGRMTLSYLFDFGLGVNLTLMNSQTDDFQYSIHNLGKYPYHPTAYQKRLLFGFQYDTFQKIQLSIK
jgi:hypothetical protein